MRLASNTVIAGAAAALAVLASGCSTTRTFVDYGRSALYSSQTAGNVPYVEIGPVVASARGFFWESCWSLAEQAVEELRADAEQRGANNVIAVRWLNHADGTYSETPMCTTGWGWFTAFVVGGFAPWVQATEARGSLALAEESNLTGLKQEVNRRMADHQRRTAASQPPAAPAAPGSQ